MPKRHLLLAAGVLAGVTVASFLLLNPVLAVAVAIGSATLLAVAALAADWERHPDFEQRELARARRRRAKWEQGAEARAKDRARWEAHQAKKAAKQPPTG